MCTTASMRWIYSAPTVDAAELILKEFDRDFGAQYPGAIDVWRNAWNEFIPFRDCPVSDSPRIRDKLGAWTHAVSQDDGLVVVHDDAVLAVPEHGAGEH